MLRKLNKLTLLLAWSLLAVAVLHGCGRSAPEVPPGEGSIVLTNDDGGNVASFRARWDDYADSGRLVELRGYCVSACTMFLSLPSVCIGPRSSFGFHSVAGAGGLPTPGAVIGERTYRSKLPPALRQWFDDNARDSREFVWLTSTELRAILPDIPVCGR